RGEEEVGTGIPCAVELLPDAADRADGTGGVDRSRPGDVVAAGQRPWGEFVDDAEREHHPGTGSADIVKLDRDVDREVVVGRQRDTDQPGVDVAGGRQLWGDLDLLLFAVPQHGQLDRLALGLLDRGAQ